MIARSRVQILFVHLILRRTHLIFFQSMFLLFSNILHCTGVYEFVEDCTCPCVPDWLTEIRQKTSWWVEAIHFTPTSPMCNPSCLFSCQGFLFCFVLSLHNSCGRLGDHGAFCHGWGPWLPGDTSCLWAAACNVEGVWASNWYKTYWTMTFSMGQEVTLGRTVSAFDWHRRRALMGKWTRETFSCVKSLHLKCSVWTSKLVWRTKQQFTDWSLWIAGVKTCQTTLLVFIHYRLSGKCDANWSRASWWQWVQSTLDSPWCHGRVFRLLVSCANT